MADFYTCPGERYRIEYAPKVQDDGTVVLVPDGKTDLQELYDSQLEQCDMSIIVKQWLAGDQTVLNRTTGQFIDTIGLPTSYAQVLQSVIDAERSFDLLPIDTKAKFQNDFRQWFATIGTEEWTKRMSDVLPGKEPQNASDSPQIDSE